MNNFITLGCAWKKKYYNKVPVNLKTSTFCSAQTKVNQIKVATKVAKHHAPVSIARFKLNFEVERDIVSMLSVVYINHGVVLQVFLKEQANKLVEIGMDMEIVQVLSRSSKRYY